MCFAACYADYRAWFDAAYFNDVKTVKSLQCYTATDSVRTDFKMTPPHIEQFQAIDYAILADAVDVVKHLLTREPWTLQGAVTIPVYLDGALSISNYSNASGSRSDKLPLYFTLPEKSSIVHLAVVCNAHRSMRVLSYHRLFDSSIANSLGCTPLMYAAALDRREVIRTFLHTVTKTDNDGNTALTYASYYGRADFLEFLLYLADESTVDIFKAVKSHNNQRCTAADMCNQVIDEKRYQTSFEGKQKCKRILGAIKPRK